VKLIVLYREDGRIVALSQVPQATSADTGIPTPRSGVKPGDGQRVAIVELEPAWQDRPLESIHQYCTIVQDGDRIPLHERSEGAKYSNVRDATRSCRAGRDVRLISAGNRAGDLVVREHLTTATTMYREMGMTYWLEKAEVQELR
jgi:hypothetical protein